MLGDENALFYLNENSVTLPGMGRLFSFFLFV